MKLNPLLGSIPLTVCLNMQSDVLAAREKRAEEIQKLLSYASTAVSLKANLPYGYKNHWTGEFLTRRFARIIESKLGGLYSCFLQGEDGLCFLFATNTSAEKVKMFALSLEEGHALGRYVDIDVLSEKGKLSREMLRKCYLCDNPAAVCVRNRSHSVEEVINFVQEQVVGYICSVVEDCIRTAVLAELSLPDKFGAVDKTGCGAHPDMSFELMLKSADAILPCMLELLKHGLQNGQICFFEAKNIGLRAEEQMFAATRGVNTYKGLIYTLGLVMLGMGQAIRQGKGQEQVFRTVAEFAARTLSETRNEETFGAKMSREGKQSAREQAAQGLPAVQNAVKFLEDKELNDENLTMALIKLIGEIDDTVMMKRAGERYEEFKALICNVKTYDINEIKQVNEKCIENNVSCGGACDLLAAAVCIKLIFEKLQL